MPITLSDIEVPIRKHPRDDGAVVDYLCTLCDEVVGYDHHLRPEPHRLDECLRKWKELREKGDVR